MPEESTKVDFAAAACSNIDMSQLRDLNSNLSNILASQYHEF